MMAILFLDIFKYQLIEALEKREKKFMNNIIKRKSNFLFFLLMTLNSLAANRINQFQFTSIATTGRGCPDGSTQVIISPDNNEVSLLFSDLIAEVPNYNSSQKNLSLKACNIIINASLPERVKVKSLDITVDYRGMTYMEKGTTVSFDARFMQFRGPRGQKYKANNILLHKEWKDGDFNEDWFVSKTKTIRLKGQCSKHKENNIIVVLKNTLKAVIRPNQQVNDPIASIFLDTADITSGAMKIKIKTMKCGSKNESRHKERAKKGRRKNKRKGRVIFKR